MLFLDLVQRYVLDADPSNIHMVHKYSHCLSSWADCGNLSLVGLSTVHPLATSPRDSGWPTLLLYPDKLCDVNTALVL